MQSPIIQLENLKFHWPSSKKNVISIASLLVEKK